MQVFFLLIFFIYILGCVWGLLLVNLLHATTPPKP